MSNDPSISEAADANDENFMIGYVVVENQLKMFKVDKRECKKYNINPEDLFDKVLKR